MRVLALDAATEACSVALMCGGDVLVRSLESGKGHAGQLLAMVEQVLAQGQLSLAMLDGIAASVGPGAFSGVRISVAVAQGLAFGAGLKVIPVTTLQALAMQVLPSGETHALACLDARMGEVYWGSFAADAVRGVAEVLGPAVAAPERVLEQIGADRSERYLGIGRGFSAHPALADIAGLDIDADRRMALPNAREIARLGTLRLSAGGGIDPVDLQPVYLRDKVALTEAERAAQ
ncbi:MAG TPA: tRNA (adenosine(37)-N6)-threonylcarbamoyltransferase complex dimerization subunit type 1 TsaB [Steroidobacteraceae bacterium]